MQTDYITRTELMRRLRIPVAHRHRLHRCEQVKPKCSPPETKSDGALEPVKLNPKQSTFFSRAKVAPPKDKDVGCEPVKLHSGFEQVEKSITQTSQPERGPKKM